MSDADVKHATFGKDVCHDRSANNMHKGTDISWNSHLKKYCVSMFCLPIFEEHFK